MRRISSSSQESALQAYYDQIRRTPLLSAEEEQELSKRIQAGDLEAKRQLIEANLRLVVKIAKAYMTPDVSLLDLIQDGNLGLLRAASRFDYRKNVRFSTYAAWWIKQAIARALANRRRPIRLPHRKENTLKRIQRCYSRLNQSLSRSPTVDEVAAEMRMKREDVAEILHISATPVSLDCEINEDSGTVMDLIEDNSFAPDHLVLEQNLRDLTRKSLESLRAREQQVLRYRYALDSAQRYTLKRISDEMGVSPETVRQIEIRALKKLRESADYLRDYVLT